MTRFFFNYRVGNDYVPDREGTELVDIAQARTEAIEDARHLMSRALLDGVDVSSRTFEICDGNGKVLLELPFAEAINHRE